jgi:replicative DNA helicase
MFEELPHNLDAETSVLGSIILEPSLINECVLQPDDFYHENHRFIMKHLIFLNDIDEPIDPIMIAQYAGKDIDKNGGIKYLVELRSSIATTANFGYYHDIVRDKATSRKAIQLMRSKADGVINAENPAEFIADTMQELEGLLDHSGNSRESIKLSDALKGHEEVIHQRKEKKGLTGTKTASTDLDVLTGGHQKGDLIIVAARPSIGKSAFMVNDANAGQYRAIKENITGSAALIFSIEMTQAKIAERSVCALSNLDHRKLQSGEMDDGDWHRWNMGVTILDGLPIFIDDSEDITLQQIERKIKKEVKKYPNLIVYIDYLQLVDCGKKGIRDDPQKNSKAVSRGLKRIARKYDIPIIAISAVGREVEKRQDKRPMMSDLRESGSIESDADVVIFLYRDDYYNKESAVKNIIELIVAKGRNIGVGTIEMIYIRSTGRFINIKRKEEGAA